MAWITPAIAAVGAIGSAVAGSMRNNNQQQQQGGMSEAELALARQNLIAQQQNQALVNQRAVAGSTDAFGGTVKYDPVTNQWITTAAPEQLRSDRAALQAGITRNTTDLQQQELANRESLRRAIAAGPTADTASRNLANFRPTSQAELIGLLTQQNTDAARAAYDPLRADTLRATARTGTAAGPVLASLGASEAGNLRSSLRDALISGMTNVDQINQSRRAGLENAAVNAATLTNPQLGQSAINPSSYGSALATLAAQRAANAATSTAQGAYGPTSALGQTTEASKQAIANVPSGNFGLNQAVSGLKDLSSIFGKGGAGSDLIAALSNSSSGSGNNTPSYYDAGPDWGNPAEVDAYNRQRSGGGF